MTFLYREDTESFDINPNLMSHVYGSSSKGVLLFIMETHRETDDELIELEDWKKFKSILDEDGEVKFYFDPMSDEMFVVENAVFREPKHMKEHCVLVEIELTKH